jgi:hypothetical protein
MAHDAFVSYSKNDIETVAAICKALEENGLSCWYAPRNVPIGADWDASIMEALAASRVMILVWSSHSDQSKQVKREVALALDEIGVTVIPFRIESIEPSKLRYYLSGIQWFDASTPPPEANLKRLVEQVKIAIPVVGQLLISEEEKLQRSGTAEKETAPEQAPEPATERAEPQYPENEQTSVDEETRLISEVKALQEAEAEALEEAEAAAYRQARLRAEVESLRHAGAAVLPPSEAEVLRRAAEAEAVQYAEDKARLVAKVEVLHQAVETARERAEKRLGKDQDEAETALAADAKNKT